MQEPQIDMNSVMPKWSEMPENYSKPISWKDDKTLSNLDSKFEDSFEDEVEKIDKPTGLLINDAQNLNEIVLNWNKRLSKIQFPGLRVGRLSKDDFESEYQRGLLSQIKVFQTSKLLQQ